MTPASILLTVRDIITDTDSSAYRQSDDELLRYLNDGLCEACIIAPQLFYVTGDMQCAPDETEQGVSFADAKEFVEVIRIKGGAAVFPADFDTLSAFNPNWGQVTAAPAANWMKKPNDLLRFYIYPKAPAVQILEVKYVANPTPLTIADMDSEITDLPGAYHPAMVDYAVYRSESKDDEHVLSQRATAHYAAFVAKLKPQGA